jgi:hypothetical protein
MGSLAAAQEQSSPERPSSQVEASSGSPILIATIKDEDEND